MSDHGKGKAGERASLASRVLLAIIVALLAAACAGEPSADLVDIRQAKFRLGDEPLPPADGSGWTEQRLPDDWLYSRPGRSGFAWYRLEFKLPDTRGGDLAVYLTAYLSNAQLFVNGTFVGQAGDLAGEPPKRWNASQLFTVPASAMRSGNNVLDLRVHAPADARGGLGAVLVGPHEPLYRRSLRDQLGHAIGPAVASLTIASLGVFMLVLWLRVRNDRTYLIFAVACILWGLHTALSLLPREPLPRPHLWVWSNVLYLAFITLLCLFVVRFTGARWPRYEMAAIAWCVATAPFLYAVPPPTFALWAAVARLGAFAIVLPALFAVTRNAWRQRDLQASLLLATTGVAFACGIHDWLAVRDPDNLRPIYLVPYVALLFIGFVGVMLIDRFARTLRQYESLTRELEQRVEEKSRALAIEVDRQAEARHEAEQANQSKSRFLAAASHDLRQPLHALGLFASALEARVKEPGSRELTARISQSIGSLEMLFDQVLDVSRLDAGVVSADVRAIALQPILDRIANDLSTSAEEKGLALRLVPTARAARSDPVLLERVLRNLVANAIRYTTRGGVLVGVRRRGGRLEIEVRDSGIGIAPEEQSRVFEEFYQSGPRADERRQGLGLGLAIVKRLGDLMGHALSLDSAPGRGTTFRVRLDEASPADVAIDAPSPLQPDRSLAGMSVVVIDDDRDVRDSMAALLGAWGCEARVHASASEAIAAGVARAAPPALALVDYRLGEGVTGIEVARELRSAWGESVPVVIISGESSSAEIAAIRASGLSLLHKPVSPARLKSLLLHRRTASAPD